MEHADLIELARLRTIALMWEMVGTGPTDEEKPVPADAQRMAELEALYPNAVLAPVLEGIDVVRNH
jgi:hypothetical protein